MNQLKGHGSGTLNGILIAAGRTEPAMAAVRAEFKEAAARTCIHGAAKGRIAAV